MLASDWLLSRIQWDELSLAWEGANTLLCNEPPVLGGWRGFHFTVLWWHLQCEAERAWPSAPRRLTCCTLRTLVSKVGDSSKRREGKDNDVYQLLVSSSRVISEEPGLGTYYCFSDHPNGYRGIQNWKISTQHYGQFTILQLIVVDRAEIVYNTAGYYCSQTALLFSWSKYSKSLFGPLFFFFSWIL